MLYFKSPIQLFATFFFGIFLSQWWFKSRNDLGYFYVMIQLYIYIYIFFFLVGSWWMKCCIFVLMLRLILNCIFPLPRAYVYVHVVWESKQWWDTISVSGKLTSSTVGHEEGQEDLQTSLFTAPFPISGHKADRLPQAPPSR